MFAARDGMRFKTPQQKSRCAKLAMGGEVVQDPEVLIPTEHMTKSRIEITPDQCELKQKVEEMETLSHEHEELLLDMPFTVEEVDWETKGKENTRTRWLDGRAFESGWGGCSHLVAEDLEWCCGTGGCTRCAEARAHSASLQRWGEGSPQSG